MSSMGFPRWMRASASVKVAVALLAATLLLLPTLLVPIAQASSVTRSFAPRFTTTDRGGITLIGNTLLTCPASATCTNAHNGTGGSINNNDFSMVYLDTDADATTFDSTSADLAVPAGSDVLFAGLYWGAASSNPARNQLKLALPGGAYQTITADNTDVSATTYISFADVTSLVAGLADPTGTYLVGNVQADIGTNTAAGWSLIVVYRDLVTPAPLRNLTVFDGLLTVNSAAPNSVSTTVSGFITPASGPVDPQVGLVALEGDLGLTGDHFLINGTQISNATNPATNVFNSSISNLGTTVTTKNPNYLNQLGFDIDLIDGTGTVPNSASSATLTFNSTGDTYYPAVLTFAVDVFQPKLNVPKTQSDLNGGTLLAGDQIEYTLDVTNNGNDTATNVVLHDPIPAGSTYVPGSLTIVSGPGAGALSDVAGDDRGEFDVGNDRVTFRLGAGGGAVNGGSLAAGATSRVRFRVSVDPGTAGGQVIQNQATVDYVGLTLGGSFTEKSDGDDASAGDQPTTLVVHAPPVAVNDSATTAEDTPLAIAVLANDTDPDGDIDPTSVTITTGPTHGTAVVNPVTGVVTYTPAANYNGPDSFSYQVCDATALCDTATVSLTVTPVADPPDAVNDVATTNEDTPALIDVLANDTDPEGNIDPTSVTITAGPTHGTTVVNPVTGVVTYTPAANYNGPDSFTYRVCDTTVPTPLCDTATVNVTVAPVADPPVAVDDSATTAEDTATVVDVLANDTDPDGDIDPTSVTITAGPTHGTTGVNPATGAVTYTPAANYNGPDSFTYRVCDATAPTPLCDAATVTLTVTPVEDPPNAVNDAATTPEDTAVVIPVLANDVDPDGNLDPTSVTITAGATNGSLSVDSLTGAVTYTPNVGYNGPDGFTYQVCDSAPTPNCDTATVTLTVTAVNAPPVAVDDIATTNEDTPVVIDVVTNDTDSDGTVDPTSVTIASGPAHGTATVNPVTGAVTYTPIANYNGPDTFTYQVCDNQGACDTATVTLTVAPVNDPPVANPDTASTANGTAVVINVLANDTDVDGNLDPTSVSIVAGPSSGHVTIDPLTGAITYTPDPGASGTDTFTYQVCDTNDVCVTAVVSVTVNVPNTNELTSLLVPPPGQPPIAAFLVIFIAGFAFVVVALGIRNRDRGRPAARGARRRTRR